MIFLSAYSCSIQTFIHPFARSFIRGDPQVRAATWNAPRREFWRLEYAKITQSSASGGRVGRSMLPLLLLQRQTLESGVVQSGGAGHFKYITREASCLPLD